MTSRVPTPCGAPGGVPARRQRPRIRLTLLVGVLGLGGLPATAIAMSGEDERTIALFGAETCVSPDLGGQQLDVISVCFQGQNGALDEGSCDLFEIARTSGAEDTLSTAFCPFRGVLRDTQFFPETGPIFTADEGKFIEGYTTGYIRAFRLAGGELLHTVTHTVGDEAFTVEISGDDATSDASCAIEVFERSSFCATVADALPKFGVEEPNIRFIVGYDYRDGDPATPDPANIKIWACGDDQGDLEAVCRAGSPTGALPGPAALLEEIWLNAGLTGPESTWNRLRR